MSSQYGNYNPYQQGPDAEGGYGQYNGQYNAQVSRNQASTAHAFLVPEDNHDEKPPS
jgi:hypothetical protein